MQSKLNTQSAAAPSLCPPRRPSRWKSNTMKALTILAVGCAVSCNATPGQRREFQIDRLSEMRREAQRAFDAELTVCRNDYPPGQSRTDCFNEARRRFREANEYIDKQNAHFLDRDTDLSEAELRAIWERLRELLPNIIDFDKWRKLFTHGSAIVPLDSTIGFDFSTGGEQSQQFEGEKGELFTIPPTLVTWSWRGMTIEFKARGALRIGETDDMTATVYTAQFSLTGPSIEAEFTTGAGETAGLVIYETPGSGYVTLKLATGEHIQTPAWAPLLPDHIAIRLPFVVEEDGSLHFSTPAGGSGSGTILPTAWWSTSDFDQDGVLNKERDYAAFIEGVERGDARADVNFDDRIDDDDIQLFLERLNEDRARDVR